MGLNHENPQGKNEGIRNKRRWLAVILGLCLLLGQVNLNSMASYAEEIETVTIPVGDNVIAVLNEGTLRLSGQGDTDDFTRESAPFLEYAQDVQRLIIDEEVTYIGSYLFYGLGNLSGEVTLPGNISGFGDFAFSGDSQDSAPCFSVVNNEASGLQQINAPGMLFYGGQTGTFISSDENTLFIEAATMAGFSSAENAGDETDEMATDESETTGIFDEEETAVPFSLVNPSEVMTVYVSQDTGDDNNDGTRENPFKTLDKAASALPADGTEDTNVIVLLDNYQIEQTEAAKEFLKEYPRSVKIRGDNSKVELILNILTTSGAVDTEACFLNLYGDICFDNLVLNQIIHIYGNGYDITVSDSVTSKGSMYLYGSGRASLSNGVGKIEVYGGSYSRISGYLRSYNDAVLDAKDLQASITVGGNAYVSSIIGGLASGSIVNGNVKINVVGGRVNGSICGGNQGFNSVKASFEGQSEINVSGGTVEKIYAAGTGRLSSIPTYTGMISINVSGGTVKDLYGSGSAAFVKSDDGGMNSSVQIQITGSGKVTNIYGAGLGGDSSLTNQESGFSESPEDFGSFTGDLNISVGNGTDNPAIGNIYAGGQGYLGSNSKYSTSNNAYLKGNANITVNSGTIGSIYAGGVGRTESGYENCAQVKAGSAVSVQINGGTVTGNVYGGGQYSKVDTDTSVTLAGGSVNGNIFGGGEQGIVTGDTEINITGGSVGQSVYGGAKGSVSSILVTGKSTINMTNGTVTGNIYGGSELSDNGLKDATDDLVFVNLVGGKIEGNVFGGGNQGKINGSTHLHIGKDAMAKCVYYDNHKDLMPTLEISSGLSINGSAYAGGNYGGAGADYGTITVSGTSHVYIDGTGYNTGDGDAGYLMDILGGVFGSGASCDAGSLRLVTLDHYGEARKSDGKTSGATRSLSAIQRADRVVIKNSHVELTGQSDVANENQTAKYSLNRIGNHGNTASLGALENSLVLQGGSTLVFDSDVLEVANLRSIQSDGTLITDLAGLNAAPNTIIFSSGKVFRLSYTNLDPDTGDEIYGGVHGYTYMAVDDTSVAYAYARYSAGDGGFYELKNDSELEYTMIGADRRYWRMAGSDASAVRELVLTAQTLSEGNSGLDGEGFSVVSGTIELPPATAGSAYTIKSVTLPTGVTLIDAAKNGTGNSAWVTSDSSIGVADEKNKINAAPLSVFGLYMGFGEGFTGNAGNVISNQTAKKGGNNSIIDQVISYDGSKGLPIINYSLVYSNDGITASQNLGSVDIELTRTADGKEEETTTMKVEIVTKASALADQTVNLYSTQSGTYSGDLVIPSGVSRNLSLKGVDVQAESGNLMPVGSSLTGNQFTVSMKPGGTNNGWNSVGLMTEVYDISRFKNGETITVGTTDNRYEATVEFTLNNSTGFTADVGDQIRLTLHDESSGEDFTITLQIHRNASIVSDIKVAAGKQYNSVAAGQDNLGISDKSSVTASFGLDFEGTEQTTNVWLELQKSDGSSVDFPSGTRLTMIAGPSFYSNIVEDGGKGRITLSEFKEMWKTGSLGNLSSGELLTFIVDFSAVETGLDTDNYNLKLKSETGADSKNARFNVNNQNGSMAFSKSGGNGLSHGEHKFTLKVNAGTDTRFGEQAAVMISLDNGSSFPDGTLIKCGSNTYYPNGSRVYLPLDLSGNSHFDIVMYTTNSTGLSPGQHTFTATVFPTGLQTGGSTDTSMVETVTYTVGANPVYSLRADLADGQSRNVHAGEAVDFIVQYASENGSASVVGVEVQKKNGQKYEDLSSGWTVAGNNVSGASGQQTVTVTVPDGTTAGTYRLNFKFGDQTVPYNIIIS